jgi:hypothetical protein
MNFKKIGKVFTSKFVGTGPSSYKRRIYRAAVSQKLRTIALESMTAVLTHPSDMLIEKNSIFRNKVDYILTYWALRCSGMLGLIVCCYLPNYTRTDPSRTWYSYSPSPETYLTGFVEVRNFWWRFFTGKICCRWEMLFS